MLNIILLTIMYVLIGFMVSVLWSYIYSLMNGYYMEHDFDSAFYILIWPLILVIIVFWFMGRASRILGNKLVERRLKNGRKKETH